MAITAHPRSLARLLAMVVLAYGLALNGLLGAISAGAHVSEARTAAQLGVICTIHGIGNADGGTEDPTPGKMACIEHCVLASGSAMAGTPAASAFIGPPERMVAAIRRPDTDVVDGIARAATPPPPRGPPSFI